MSRVVLKENENLDDALRRFKRQVSRNGTLAEARKREFYVKPGLKRKLKSEAARKARRQKLHENIKTLENFQRRISKFRPKRMA